MGTAKRDISAVETSFELSSLPLYRSSHTFQNLSLTGARILKSCLQMKVYHDDISSSERDKYLSKGVLFVTVKPLFLRILAPVRLKFWKVSFY
jgi:hypothetical protein